MDADAQNQEGQVVEGDVLGYCNECHRVRWLGVIDGRVGNRDGSPGMPYGTCRQCVREAEEGD